MMGSHSPPCVRDITKTNHLRQINRHSWNAIFWHNNWHNVTFSGIFKKRGLRAICGYRYVGLFNNSVSCTVHDQVYEVFMPETLLQKELHGGLFLWFLQNFSK